MQCDMCGASTNLFRVLIEGTEMNVCSNCSSHGKILGSVKSKEEVEQEEESVKNILETRTKQVENPLVERIVSDFAAIIRKKRESLGLKQEELAKKLNEKESVIHKMETGSFTPSFSLARKIEHFFGVRLIEMVRAEKADIKVASGTLTLGDLMSSKQK